MDEIEQSDEAIVHVGFTGVFVLSSGREILGEVIDHTVHADGIEVYGVVEFRILPGIGYDSVRPWAIRVDRIDAVGLDSTLGAWIVAKSKA